MNKSICARVEALERRSGPVPLIVALDGESSDQAIKRQVGLSDHQRRRAIVVHTGVPANHVWNPSYEHSRPS